MSGKNVLIVSEIKGVPIDPNAQDDNLRGDIFALDRKIAQNDSDKRAIQRMSDDKRITPKQASTANQRIDADNAKLKEKRSELKEKLKKNEAAKQPAAKKAPDKPVVPNVQGLLFSRTVTNNESANENPTKAPEYQSTSDNNSSKDKQEVDEMGQPLHGRSNYDAFKAFGDIWKSDTSALEKLKKTGSWMFYTVPDAQQRRAEFIAAQQAEDARWATIDAARNSTLAGILIVGGSAAGADKETIDKLAQTGQVVGGALGSLAAGGSRINLALPPVKGRDQDGRFHPNANAQQAANGVAVEQLSDEALYQRPTFRKSANQKAINAAPRNKNGKMICPTCGEEIPPTITRETINGPKTRRGHDLDHYPDTWAERVDAMKQREARPTRAEVINEYNERLRVQCPPCNQSHEFEGVPGTYKGDE